MTIDPKDNNIEVADRALYVLTQAGSEGMRPRDIATSIGKSKELMSFALRKLLQAGKAARFNVAPNHARLWAIAFAPPHAKTLPPKQKRIRVPLPDSPAVTDALALLAKAGTFGLLAVNIARARGVDRSSTARVLWKLAAAGRCVARPCRDKTTRYFLPEHAPAYVAPVAPVAAKKKPPPTPKPPTTIQPSRMRIDPDAPSVMTARTKITIIKPPPGRFDFDPPPGWSGQITKDWRERRLQNAQSIKGKAA